MEEKFAVLVSRLESVTARLEVLEKEGGAAVPVGGGGGGASSGPVDDGDEAPSVSAFNAFLDGEFAAYVACAGKLGEDVVKQTAIVKKAFEAQRDMLAVVSKCKKPSDADFQNLIQETSKLLGDVQGAVDRRSKQFNHLNALGESIPALGWVCVEKTPGPHVTQMMESGEFYSNKVMMEFKGKDEDQVAWAKAFKAMWVALVAYIKEHHRTGLSWNMKGGEVKDCKKGGAPKPPAGGPPPPPKAPPPPPPGSLDAPKADAGGGGAAAVFAELNKGADITKGLKKVDKADRNVKGPGLEPKAKAPAAAPKPAAAAPKKPPRFELDGKKWMVEHQDGNSNIAITDTNIKQTVYIFGCTNSVVKVDGKVTNITMDNCKKTAVVLDTVISGIDLVNCTSAKVQITGQCANINVDKCTGAQLILNRECLDAEVVSSKTSELNIIVPGKTDDDDYKEFAISEQFVSRYDKEKGEYKTEPLVHGI